ncbi:MAG TPA: hypothetical protein VFS97_08770 [Nitrososphaeraceae archaeon]|nr:hypothetical protein [Nitrososphaeraceae archaeon]
MKSYQGRNQNQKWFKETELARQEYKETGLSANKSGLIRLEQMEQTINLD